MILGVPSCRRHRPHARSISDFECRAVLGPCTAVIVDARGGDIGVAEPFLHLGDISLVIERIDGRGRAQRVRGAFCSGPDRVNTHRPSDVLQRLLAEIDKFMFQLVAHLPVRVLRKKDRPRRGGECRCGIRCADRRAFRCCARSSRLNRDGAAYGSTTLRNSTIAPSPVRLNTRPFWLATVGSMRSARNARSRASAILVRARHPAEADNVGGEDRRDFPGLGHSGRSTKAGL